MANTRCSAGLKARECLECGFTEVKILHAEHDYITHESKEPTCTSIGWNAYRECVLCGNSNYEELPALGHNASWVTVTELSCMTDGVEVYECARCHIILDRRVTSAPGHVSDGTECIYCHLPEYTLTIHYVYADGSLAADDYVARVWKDTSYSISSPMIENYVADQPIISGVAIDHAEITVTYNAITLQSIVRLDTVALGNVNYNTPYSELRLPSTVKGYTADGREVFLTVYWNATTYSPTTYGDQTISGVVVADYGYVLTCSNVAQATLTIANNIIVDIPTMNLGRLPLGTSYDGLGLPSTAAVTTSTGAIYYLPVSWNSYSYDSSVAGSHTIEGVVSLEDGFVLASDVSTTATIVFELSESMYGTADIVFIVDTTGSMWGEIQNVKNNIIRFAERLEAEGVSVRWALLEYRDITCDGLASTKVIYCGASEWYIDVHAYENALARLNVSGGGDREETVIDALKAATYLETREGVHTFYIVVTDADYKVNNRYGIGSLAEMTNELVSSQIVTSVVTKPMFYDDYRPMTDATQGILANIDGDFAAELWRLSDWIIEDVVYGEVDHIEIVQNPTKLNYLSGDYFDGNGMIVRAYYKNGSSRNITAYSVSPYTALQVTDTQIEINYRGLIATIDITVVQPEIPVDGVTLSHSSVELTVGETITVVATVSPIDAINKNVIWSTQNPNVAIVYNGIIEAIGVGETTITVTTLDGGYTATLTVVVTAPEIPVAGIYTNVGAVEMNVGDRTTIVATVLPLNATNREVIWTSSNSSVATVENGVVRAISSGTATITVTTVDGEYRAYVYIVVNAQNGNVTGQVYTASSSSPLSNVTVELYKNGSLLSTTTTNSAGTYSFNNLVYGDYILKFIKTDYITATMNITVARENTQLANMYLTLDSSRTGNISGYALTSTSGSGISGIKIYVRSGSGNTSGTALYTTTTSSSGSYSLSDLPAGTYTLQFVDERSVSNRYLTTSINVTVIGGSTVTNQNAIMTLPLSEGRMEIKLAWGSSPNDLDSHLLINSNYHVYYSNKNPSGAGASLDVDDTSAYGPETITITSIKENGKYVYYVYNYSNYGTFSASNAVVTLTYGSEVQQFRPPVGSGYYWKVFTYDAATDTITVHNTIMSTAPTY